MPHTPTKTADVQRFSASMMTPILNLAASIKATADDGLAWFRYFPIGMAPMAEMDWRQWELTPENATLMVTDVMARIQAGAVVFSTYTHCEDGPKSCEHRSFELRPEGVWTGVVWTPPAKTAITSTPSEWDSYSPEFYAQSPFDQDGNPLTFNGRVVLRPFRIDECAGALTNHASIVGLKAAASMAPNPNPPRAGESTKEDAMSAELEATMKNLQSEFASLRTSTDEKLEAAKKTNEAQAAEIATLKASRDLTELVKRGRVDRKITEANEPKVKEHFEKFGLAAAEAFVSALPASAPRGGSVTATLGGSGGSVASATKRFATDSIGEAAKAGLDPARVDLDRRAHEYAAENKVTYVEAVLAVSRKEN